MLNSTRSSIGWEIIKPLGEAAVKYDNKASEPVPVKSNHGITSRSLETHFSNTNSQQKETIALLKNNLRWFDFFPQFCIAGVVVTAVVMYKAYKEKGTLGTFVLRWWNCINTFWFGYLMQLLIEQLGGAKSLLMSARRQLLGVWNGLKIKTRFGDFATAIIAWVFFIALSISPAVCTEYCRNR